VGHFRFFLSKQKHRIRITAAGVIYFVPMTRFVDNLSDRVAAAAE